MQTIRFEATPNALGLTRARLTKRQRSALVRGRKAVEMAANGATLLTWNEQWGWVKADLALAQRIIAHNDSMPENGLRANGEASLLHYAVVAG